MSSDQPFQPATQPADQPSTQRHVTGTGPRRDGCRDPASRPSARPSPSACGCRSRTPTTSTPANIAKMTSGQALDDDDRQPVARGDRGVARRPSRRGVMSCSALKRKYRDQLRRHAPDAEFLYLEGSPGVIARRQASRPATSCRPRCSSRSSRPSNPFSPTSAARWSTSTRASTRSSSSTSTERPPPPRAHPPKQGEVMSTLSVVLPMAAADPRPAGRLRLAADRRRPARHRGDRRPHHGAQGAPSWRWSSVASPSASSPA